MTSSLSRRADDGVARIVAEVLSQGLFLDPPLTGMEWEQFSGEAFRVLSWTASDILSAEDVESGSAQKSRAILCAAGLRYMAVYEFLASTATLLAQETSGKLIVNGQVAGLAATRLRGYLNRYGLDRLVQAYAAISTYHNLQVIRHYGSVRERDFVHGILHRPWVNRPLTDEVELLRQEGLISTSGAPGEKDRIADRRVSLTASGENALRKLERELAETEYFPRRAFCHAVSHWNRIADWRAARLRIWPSAARDRLKILEAAGNPPVGRILEVGLGNADFGAELAGEQSVARTSFVELSSGLLGQAREGIREEGKRISLRQGGYDQVPFPSSSFDMAVGYALFHHTKSGRALPELLRVVRPGGTVVVVEPTGLLWEGPFFRDWFSPLFQQSRRFRNGGAKDRLTYGRATRRVLERLGLRLVRTARVRIEWFLGGPLPDAQNLIIGSGFFRGQLIHLPWKAREELLEEIRERGEKLLGCYTESERKIHISGELLIGVK